MRRTSKRTFYDQFGTKEDGFLELLRANNSALVERHPGRGRSRGRLAGSDRAGGRRLRRPHRVRARRSP